MESKNILVFAPHPDDEIIGCGGFLLNRRKRYQINIVYVTNGSFQELKQSGEIRKRRVKETKVVCSLLKARAFHLNLKDRFITNNTMLVKKILRILQTNQPEIILIPHSDEDDSDHRIVSLSVKEALFIGSKLYQKKNWSPGLLLGYEIWTPLQDYNYIENITAVIDKKLELTRVYSSQKSRLRIDDMVESLNRYRGITSGKGEFCEFFKIYSIKQVI